VPFSFIPTSGSAKPTPPKPVTRVRALEERAALEMRFPRLQGYRYDLPPEKLAARFTGDSRYVLSTADVPTETYNAPIVGETSTHTLAELRNRRELEVDFRVAQCLLENFFRDDQGNLKPWLFPQLLAITKQWRRECLALKDDTFPQMLLWIEFASEAANRIYRSIVDATAGEKVLKPILYPYDTEGSTRFVDFDTSRAVYATREDRCHISHVVADTDSWEQKMAQTLESMDQVASYFKNHNVGFTIPYTLSGHERNYVPDFCGETQDGGRRGEPDHRGDRREASGQSGEGGDRSNPLGSRREQPWRFRSFGRSWRLPTPGTRKRRSWLPPTSRQRWRWHETRMRRGRPVVRDEAGDRA